MEFILKDVEYFSQRDNTNLPYYTCYNTSVAMAINYILQKLNLNKTHIGCPEDKQLEDYLFDLISTPDTKKWIKQNVSKYGDWMNEMAPQTIAYVEEYIFNKLMKPYGYTCKFVTNAPFNYICDLIATEQLPQIIHGKYPLENKTLGHISLAVGFDLEKELFIAHDPYGDFNTGYKTTNGAFVKYPLNHPKGPQYLKDIKKRTMWCTTFTKI